MSQVMYQVHDKRWDNYCVALRDRLLGTQNAGGSWNGDGGGPVDGAIACHRPRTAVWLRAAYSAMNRIRLILAAILFTTSLASADVLVLADWAKGSRTVPGLWQELHALGRDRFRGERDPSSPKGATVARVEVRAGDKVNGWSGERAEVSGMRTVHGKPLPVTTSSGHEFYGLSIKLDTKWQAPQTNAAGYAWGTFFQLHGQDNLHVSPSVALMAEQDLHINVCGGDVTDGGKRSKPRGAVSYAFTDGSLNLGRWSEFLMDVVWAADETGSIVIYRRNEGKAQWVKVFEKQHMPTLQYQSGQPVGEHYWKAGFYRSESHHTNLLWLGPIVRGTSRNEVATAAFGRP